MEREDELLPGKYSECSTLLVWATPQGIMGLPSVCFWSGEMALLDQWFSKSNFAPMGHRQCPHTFLVVTTDVVEGFWLPVGRVQGSYMTAPQQRIIQPQILILLRLRNPVLPQWFKIWLRYISWEAKSQPLASPFSVTYPEFLFNLAWICLWIQFVHVIIQRPNLGSRDGGVSTKAGF